MRDLLYGTIQIIIFIGGMSLFYLATAFILFDLDFLKDVSAWSAGARLVLISYAFVASVVSVVASIVGVNQIK